ncbi:MAG: tRNA (adenosine(37)-N6)-dimethylallyltransferase MiaA [Candidatus Omnitrophota bacterium]
MKHRVVFLVGPTAVGKSAVGVCLAGKIGGEIISCDSMQVYKGMEIISCQPDEGLKKKIPHHLIAEVLPSREFNVSSYRRRAVKLIDQIIKRGRVPVFVGGTGLYMSIVIDGIFIVKAEDLALREKFYQQALEHGSAFLHERLKKVDPEAAGKIHPNDTRRMVRALEVFEVTGKPISFLQKQRKGIVDKYDLSIFCLNMERQLLYKRIKQRVDEMFALGLEDEVKNLLKRKLSMTASKAIGIAELKGYFDGEYGLEEAKEKICRNTCLYSKRQLTWFRKDKRVRWIDVGLEDKPRDVAGRIIKYFSPFKKGGL